MTLKVVTVSQFAQAYRKASGESVSISDLMSKPSQASLLAQKALLLENALVTPFALALLNEMGINVPNLVQSGFVKGNVAPLESRKESHLKEATPTSFSDPSIQLESKANISSQSVDEVWDHMAASAREISGPMGGAIVTKFRRENPELSSEQALPILRDKLGENGPEFIRLFKMIKR